MDKQQLYKFTYIIPFNISKKLLHLAYQIHYNKNKENVKE